MNLVEYYRGKRVLVTGHNGFKGTWLTQWLIEMGADVYGVSLSNDDEYSLFEILDCKSQITHKEFDIRDYDKLLDYVKSSSPEIVFHLAAQPIVLESYNDPMYTHQVNYLGALNVLESIRNVDSVKTVIIVTSDKVYKLNETGKALNELDQLGGIDPYSASKSAVEILVNSYRESFYNDLGISLFTVRAGNVIGFGDYGKNRLFPDILKAIANNSSLTIRNPMSIRPWQNINDVCFGYLKVPLFEKNLVKNKSFSINFGPSKTSVTVKQILEIFESEGKPVRYNVVHSRYVETKNLFLNSELASLLLNWNITQSIEATIKEIIIFNDLLQFKSYTLLAAKIKFSINKFLGFF